VKYTSISNSALSTCLLYFVASYIIIMLALESANTSSDYKQHAVHFQHSDLITKWISTFSFSDRLTTLAYALQEL